MLSFVGDGECPEAFVGPAHLKLGPLSMADLQPREVTSDLLLGSVQVNGSSVV